MNDAHNLNRFIEAQQDVYAAALDELGAGAKHGHWMWFIFPQAAGLGRSATSQMYAIGSLQEARAYYDHIALGPRLRECTQAVLGVGDRSAGQIFGHVDGLRFRSCMTLFERATDDDLFRDALEKHFDGAADARTIEIVASWNA